MHHIEQRGAFRTQRATVGRVIGIALDMENIAFSPFFRSPFEYMMMPQATEQYGQVLRVSVALASLKGLTCAATIAAAEVQPNAPKAEPATPTPAAFNKCRREISMLIGPSSTFIVFDEPDHQFRVTLNLTLVGSTSTRLCNDASKSHD